MGGVPVAPPGHPPADVEVVNHAVQPVVVEILDSDSEEAVQDLEVPVQQRRGTRLAPVVQPPRRSLRIQESQLPRRSQRLQAAPRSRAEA